MIEDIRVAAIQFDIAWEQPMVNLAKLDQLMSTIKEVDLIVLPEMFTTGFTMNPSQHAEKFHPAMSSLQWMQDKAQTHQAVILGSIAVEENTAYYNRLFVVFPNRTFIRYDKNKLFQMGEENRHYTSGSEPIEFEWKGWKIKPLICYELRFPELARNRSVEKYDLLVYVANWPEVRRHPWRTLLEARAIENQCYLIGVNRIGEDNNDLKHSGDSLIIDARGHILQDGQGGKEVILRATFNHSELLEFREKFPVLLDID